MAEPSKIGDMVGNLVDRLQPVHARCDSVAEALGTLLPPTMQDHCSLGGVSGGCLTLIVSGASYMYELQLCKADLLQELQRLCPAAGLRRIQIDMAGRR
jgi:hypothetical protein